MDSELLKVCELCGLSKSRTQVVLPRGNPSAKIMFIGEAPGRNEDKAGKPFVGAAGMWFDAAMEYLQLEEGDFYLTNTVKCRPVDEKGNNRTPTENEIISCGRWLISEIEKVNPKVIVLMGGTALKAFFRNTKISNVAGEEILGHKYLTDKGIRLFVIYHPAVMVYNKRHYEPIYKRGLDNLRRILEEEELI